MAVQEWEKPNTITGLRAFLGFANYYSGYVRDYGGIVSPMVELLKVGSLEGKEGSTTMVKWTAEADLAFVASKEAFSPDFSLQTVNPDLPFVLRADASGKAIGAVLEQLPAGVKM